MSDLKDLTPTGHSPNRQDAILARVFVGVFILFACLLGAGIWWLSGNVAPRGEDKTDERSAVATENLAALVVWATHDEPEYVQKVEDSKPRAREWVESLSDKEQQKLRRASEALADALDASGVELMHQMANGKLDSERLLAAGTEQSHWFVHIAGFSNVWTWLQNNRRDEVTQLEQNWDQGILASALSEMGPYAAPTNLPEIDRKLTVSMLQHGAPLLEARLKANREKTAGLIRDVFGRPTLRAKGGTTTLAARAVGGVLLLVWLYFIPVGRKVMMAQGQMMHATVFQFNILPFIVAMSLIVSGSLWFLLVLPVGLLLAPAFPRFFMYSFPVGFGWATGAHIMTGLFPASRGWYWGGGVLGVVAMFIFCSIVVGIVTTPSRS